VEDAMEIAEKMLKITNNDEGDISLVEEALADKWGIDLDGFQEITQAFFDMIDFSVSPLTDTPLVGFGTGHIWFCKKEVNQQFIAGLIQWATQGEDIPKGAKGFMRTITKDGKPEFNITISKATGKEAE